MNTLQYNKGNKDRLSLFSRPVDLVFDMTIMSLNSPIAQFRYQALLKIRIGDIHPHLPLLIDIATSDELQDNKDTALGLIAHIPHPYIRKIITGEVLNQPTVKNLSALTTYLKTAQEDLKEEDPLNETIKACLKPTVDAFIIAQALILLNTGNYCKN
jgi:hypothetical protein